MWLGVFRDLSTDNSLWTELVLDYKYIKLDVIGCRQLVDRCKKLSSLEIFVNLDILDESLVKDSLNIMNVVIGSKQSLMSLEVDQNIQEKY